MNRRQWLKGATAGAAALLTGWAFWPHGTPSATDPDGANAARYRALSPADRAILAALLPAFLGLTQDKVTAAEMAAVLRDIDATIVRQKASVQDELSQLFTLLSTHAGSYALLGVANVATAPADALAQGLEALRLREFATFRQAYGGLRELCLGLWYGQPDHWQQIAYPGPPDLMKGPRL